MKPANRSTKAGVADDVLEYLVQHPDAQDTLEGVCDWWLLERRVRRTVDEVKLALGDLVARGFLVVRRGKDGKAQYRVKRQGERTGRRACMPPAGKQGKARRK